MEGGLRVHLYSQKVSSFISCDSTSGWRSSFSLTTEGGRTHYFIYFAAKFKSSTFDPPREAARAVDFSLLPPVINLSSHNAGALKISAKEYFKFCRSDLI